MGWSTTITSLCVLHSCTVWWLCFVDEEMETGESNNATGSNQSCALSKDSSWWSQFRNVSNPWMARYVYGFIFLVANLLAWAARDELTSLKALTQMKGKNSCLNT